MDYSDSDTIDVEPVVGYDWYATGYCISHFDERWGLLIFDDNMGMEGVNLLVKGLRSSPIAKKRIQYLSLHSLSFSQLVVPLKEFCELEYLYIYNSDDHNDRDDVVILQQLIAPGSGLKRLEYQDNVNTCEFLMNTFVPLLFQPSSLQELELNFVKFDDLEDIIVLHDELLQHENTNIKELTIRRNLFHPLAALIMNITSLTYLPGDICWSTRQ